MRISHNQQLNQRGRGFGYNYIHYIPLLEGRSQTSPSHTWQEPDNNAVVCFKTKRDATEIDALFCSR